MRKLIPALVLAMLIGEFAFSQTPNKIAQSSSQSNDAVPAFWRKFESAVISTDKKTVAGLSSFPIGLSYDERSIESRAELIRRFSEVFNGPINAAQCFAGKEPTMDTENRNRFTVACPTDKVGGKRVIFEFERNKVGWRFSHRQFQTGCSCR